MKINPNDPIYFDLLAIMRQRIACVEMTIPEFTELNAPLANEDKAGSELLPVFWAACKEFLVVNLELRTIYEREPRQPENLTRLQKIFNAPTILNLLMSLYVMPDQIDSEPSAHPEASPRPLCGELDIYFIKI